MSFLSVIRRWIRSIRASVRYVLRLPGKLNLVDMTVHAFAFPQHEWAKRMRANLADDRDTIRWQQAINPLFWFAWSFRFIKDWIISRPVTTLAPAIPAVIVALVLAATVYVIVRRDETEIQTIYLDRLRTSIASGDTAAASVAAQRLLAIDPNNLEHQYQLALLEHQIGKEDSATAAIYHLATAKEYGPAALWMLKAIIYDDPKSTSIGDDGTTPLTKRKDWTQDQLTVCHRCATVAMTNLPSKRATLAKRMYAEFLADQGNTRDALRLYSSISQFDPSVNLVAAQLSARAKDFAAAKLFATAAVRHYEPRLLSDPTDLSLRISLAQSLILDEQDDRAYELLMDGLKYSPNEAMLKIAAGEALIFRSDRLKRSVGENETLLQRAELLIKALQLAPKSPLVLEAVVQLAMECGEADTDKLKRVRNALLRGVSPAAMHFVEGTVLLMAGENDAAQHHLELAVKEGGNMAGLLNNLAVALGASGDKHLPQALRFSNEALRQLPDHPYLLETRGQILLRLDRYSDAIVDLEKALAAPEMRPMAHTGLAKAYAELGVEDLAEQNRVLAESYALPINAQ